MSLGRADIFSSELNPVPPVVRIFCDSSPSRAFPHPQHSPDSLEHAGNSNQSVNSGHPRGLPPCVPVP